MANLTFLLVRMVDGDFIMFCLREMAHKQLCGVIHNHELREADCLAREQSILQLDMKSVTAGDLEVSVRTRRSVKFGYISDQKFGRETVASVVNDSQLRLKCIVDNRELKRLDIAIDCHNVVDNSFNRPCSLSFVRLFARSFVRYCINL